MPKVKVAHTPDADDAFMFHGITSGKVPLPDGLEIEHVVEDIESLNQKALAAALEVTAVSFHAYAHISKNYRILASGASVGDGYGPIVVAKPGADLTKVERGPVLIPGKLTTAFLVLKLRFPKVRYKVERFDLIPEAVAAGRGVAGVLIHEGQLTFAKSGLKKLLDLGDWWEAETSLPLPLGTNVVRRDVPRPDLVCRALRDSVKYALEHREDALASAMKYARGMTKADALKFVGMYVNEFTLDLGPRGQKAVKELLERGQAEGVTPGMPALDYVKAG
jgi:1,4-dihydroxy-6-naphthoate synthase